MAEAAAPLRRLALMPRGVRAKLLCAFVLMSAVPLTMLVLVAAWFAFPRVRDFYRLEQIFPVIATAEATWWLLGLIALTAAIALLGGYYLLMKIVQPVVLLSEQAKTLATASAGPAARPINTGDELGDLTVSLRQVTGKIRDNLTELKQFGARTTELNLEINRRVLMLSGLLHISELISNGGDLDTVLDAIIEKVAVVQDSSFSFLCLQPLESISVLLRRAHRLDLTRLDGLTGQSGQLVIDVATTAPESVRHAWEQLGRPNLLIQPVIVRDRLIGMLGVGNRAPGFRWTPDLIDLVSIFVRQTSIAVENELLLKKAKALAIRDELTGLYNESYIRQRLNEEIKRAAIYQRPCAFAMFVIAGFAGLRQRYGDPEAERLLKKSAKLLQESLTDVDRAGRFSGNELVVVLPERNKREGAELIEQVHKQVSTSWAIGRDVPERLQLVGVVTENPVDGMTAEELIDKATAEIRHHAGAVESRSI